MKPPKRQFQITCTSFLLLVIFQSGQATEPSKTKVQSFDAGDALVLRQVFGFQAFERQSGYTADLAYTVPAVIPESTLVAYAEYRSRTICGGLNYRWLSHSNSGDGGRIEGAERSMNITVECLWHPWQ